MWLRGVFAVHEWQYMIRIVWRELMCHTPGWQETAYWILITITEVFNMDQNDTPWSLHTLWHMSHDMTTRAFQLDNLFLVLPKRSIMRLICSISDLPGRSGLWSRSSPRMQPAAHMSTPVVCVLAWSDMKKENFVKHDLSVCFYFHYVKKQISYQILFCVHVVFLANCIISTIFRHLMSSKKYF